MDRHPFTRFSRFPSSCRCLAPAVLPYFCHHFCFNQPPTILSSDERRRFDRKPRPPHTHADRRGRLLACRMQEQASQREEREREDSKSAAGAWEERREAHESSITLKPRTRTSCVCTSPPVPLSRSHQSALTFAISVSVFSHPPSIPFLPPSASHVSQSLTRRPSIQHPPLLFIFTRSRFSLQVSRSCCRSGSAFEAGA